MGLYLLIFLTSCWLFKEDQFQNLKSYVSNIVKINSVYI